MSVRCAFCDIVERRAPASIVAEGAHVLSFMDLRQPVPGHVLVVPRQHVEALYDLPDAVAAEMMRLAVRVARAARAQYDPPGLNLWQSNGHAGGQEVPHVHLHIQPRRHRDGLFRLYPQGLPALATRPVLEAMAAELRLHLHGLSSSSDERHLHDDHP